MATITKNEMFGQRRGGWCWGAVCVAALLVVPASSMAQGYGDPSRPAVQRRAAQYWAHQRAGGGQTQRPVVRQRGKAGKKAGNAAMRRLQPRGSFKLNRPATATSKTVKKHRKFKGLRLKTRMRLLTRGLRRSSLGQFAAGLFVDGPKESWQAIRRNPKAFAVGLCLTGACAVGGELLALPAHQLLVGASGAAAGIEAVQIYRNEFRKAGGRKQKARIAGKMAWLPSLVLATAVAGSHLGSHSTAHHSLATLSASFASGVVTGGDMPTALVTAWQTWRQGKKATKVQLRTSPKLGY